jgi:ketosteroid isomerase-like protein
MAPDQIERLMRDLYAARARGDLAAVGELFAADAVLRIAGGSVARPVAIKAEGVAEVRPLLALLIKTFKLADFTIVASEIEGSHAIVHWRANVRSRITGATTSTELIDQVVVRDGSIADFDEVIVPR